MYKIEKVPEIFLKNLSNFLSGTGLTLELAFYTVIFGTLLGVIVTLLRRCKIAPVRWIMNLYVEFLRGTPLLVQALMVVYGAPQLGINPGRKMLSIIALVINSSAYMSEIVRAGIQAIDHGQTEAAVSLGMTRTQNMLYIILPQAMKTTLPAMGNEFVSIIKESSLLYAVGLYELTYQAQKLAATNYLYLETMTVAALVYFVLTFTASRLLGLLERRLRQSEQH
ncbi:MAG: amino acid ABC transporter permease [Christensenellales bacterium]|jgi:arginine/lysine/histidine transport system permease protein|nr:amino acid ABC transporter permease [Clostridiales bacterium]